MTLVAAAVELRSQFESAGAEMDEGLVLVYGERVLEGDLPHRDFHSFYGPANPWVVAAAFGVFGRDLEVERWLGIVYRLAVVLGALVLALRWGLVAGLLAAASALVVIGGSELFAWASYGALALATWGLVLVVAAAAARDDVRRALLLAAGVLAGAATLMRFDVAPAAIAAGAPVVVALGGGAWRRWAVGFAIGAVPWLLHLVLVGPSRIEQLVRELFASQPGRRLPLEPVLSFPTNLLVAGTVAAAVLAVTGAVVWARRGRGSDGSVVVALGLFSSLLLPLAYARPDRQHVVAAVLVPLTLAPVAAVVAVREVAPRWPRRIPRAVGIAALVVAVAFVAYTVRNWVSHGNLAPLREVTRGVELAHRGRTFFLADRAVAADVRASIADVERMSRSGQRLFVGPQDLRRTNYADTYLYFLLPQLEPASYYLELNPETANRDGSSLASDLARADVLILTSRYDDVGEPNESARFGSPAANAVVRRAFCVRARHGTYRVYERCR